MIGRDVFHSDALTLLSDHDTEYECGTLRLALLKIGARVTKSVRRIKLAMTSAYPWQHEWALAHARMTAAAA